MAKPFEVGGTIVARIMATVRFVIGTHYILARRLKKELVTEISTVSPTVQTVLFVGRVMLPAGTNVLINTSWQD